MAAAVESLPLGVGRVPKWWMECTPHYLLDVEEDQENRLREARLAYYFAQMAAADDAGLVGPDGKPVLGPDGKPVSWRNCWSGRQGGSGGYEPPVSPGGRNFAPGGFRLDPKLFGIEESDPDYNSYLTGAKLPPGFMEKMEQMFGTESIPNNLKQTDYGRYGRQAEKPAFVPTWTKKKLRATSDGENIRKGLYNDSPNKHHRRPIPGASELAKTQAPPALDSEPEPAPVELEQLEASEAMVKAESPVAAPVENECEPEAAPSTVQEEPIVEAESPVAAPVEPVSEPEAAPSTVQEEPIVEAESPVAVPVEPVSEPEAVPSTVSFPSPQRESPESVKVETDDLPAMSLATEPAKSIDAEHAEMEDTYYTEEEVFTDDELAFNDEEYEEESIEHSQGEEDELDDLQAILAAKQAELARLQAQLEA